MLRHFIIQLAWFLLPFVVYGIYVHGGRLLFPGRRPKPKFSVKTLGTLVACGMFLVAGSLFTFALLEGESADKEYAPPRFEQGVIVPGQFQ